jgi:hypothetical protein
MLANSLVLSLFSERVDLSDEPTPAAWLALGTTSELPVIRPRMHCEWMIHIGAVPVHHARHVINFAARGEK